jgi:hypothetical protein
MCPRAEVVVLWCESVDIVECLKDIIAKQGEL